MEENSLTRAGNIIILQINSDMNKISEAAEKMQKGLFRQAKEIYELILERTNTLFQSTDITILQKIPKVNESLELIKRLCNHHLGSIELFNKNYSKAHIHFEEALQNVSSEVDKLFLNKMLGYCLLGLGDFVKAVNLFSSLKISDLQIKDKSSILISLARALYHVDNSNINKSLNILEDIVLKDDPNNVEALVYLSDFLVRRGLAKLCIQHMLMAIAYSSLRKDTQKEAVDLVKRNFANTMKLDVCNLIFFETIKSDMSVYRHMAQVLKDFGAAESSLIVFTKALEFENVKSNPKEIILVVSNVIGVLEVLNKHQESFNAIKSFIGSIDYGNLKVGNLKNSDVYEIIKNTNKIFGLCSFKRNEQEIFLNENKDQDLTLDIPPINYNDLELDLLAIYFSLVKILFISGALNLVSQLIFILDPLVKGRNLHTTNIRNQNSYYRYISALIEYLNKQESTFNSDSSDSSDILDSEKIYLCGDSHSLALAWHTCCNNKLFVPKLVTGLKCWHMKPETIFFTKKNLDCVVDSIPDKSIVIFIFGEIDCREGILGAYEKCRYSSLEEGVKYTADIYLNTILKIEEKKGIKAYVHPVPPVLDLTRKIVKLFNQYLKSQNLVNYMDFGDHLLSQDKETFNKEYELDNTHMAPTYKKLIQDYFTK